MVTSGHDTSGNGVCTVSRAFHSTLTRTGLIAVAVATVAVWRTVGLSPFPLALWLSLVACVLWFSFGGHWVELFFLNGVRPRLPRVRWVQIVCRIALWFVGGTALMAGMRATFMLLMQRPAPWQDRWWQGGVSFIVIELLVHAVLLQARGRPSFYNGKG